MGRNFCIAGDSNTPAQNTNELFQNVLVDWVTASFHAEKNIQEILQLFWLTELEIEGQIIDVDFEKIEGARYKYAGYNVTYKYSNIEIMHDPENHKWLINLSGQACREFEKISKLNYEMLFGLLVGQLNANVSRIDIAIDDYKSIFKVNTIRKAVMNGQAVTKIKKFGSHTQGKIEDGTLTMDNFYLGTLSSRYSINVYDKKLEQESKNKEVKVKSWVRTEVRLKEEYATAFARIIATSSGNENIGQYIVQFLNQSVVFLKKGCKETNRSRASKNIENYAHWWKKFIGDVGRLKLSQKAPEKSVERTVSWFVEQVAPSLAVCLEVDPEGFSHMLFKLCEDGKQRLNKTHELMIKQAKENSLTLVEVLDQFEKAYN